MKIIKCRILNNDQTAEDLGLDPKRIWAEFLFDETEVWAWAQWLEKNEVQADCVEVFFKSGKQFILNIPFVRFDKHMTRNEKSYVI